MRQLDCSINSFICNSLQKQNSPTCQFKLKKLEKYEPSVIEQQIKNVQVSDPKSVFNKVDINSISVRKFNLDGCEEQPQAFDGIHNS